MAVPILKEPPITTREALIPYAMSGVNMLAPVLVAHATLAQVPLVFETAIAMIIFGLPVSIYFRQRRYNRIALNLITMLPLLILTWALTHMHPGLQIDWNNPWQSMMNKDTYDAMNGLLLVFVLLSSGRAFLLVTSTDMLQTPLPSFSIFLLAAITNNVHHADNVTPFDHLPFTFFCLLLLCTSTLYLFSQEHSQRWFAIHTPLRFQRRLILRIVIFSVLILPVIVGTGWLLQPLNMTNLARHAQDRHPFNFHFPFFSSQQVAVSFGENLDMLTADWPSGKQDIMTVKVSGKAQDLLWRAGSYAFYDSTTKQWQTEPPMTNVEQEVNSMPWTTVPNEDGSLTGQLNPLRARQRSRSGRGHQRRSHRSGKSRESSRPGGNFASQSHRPVRSDLWTISNLSGYRGKRRKHDPAHF